MHRGASPGLEGWAGPGPRNLRAVLVTTGGRDPLYASQRSLWLLREETGRGRQEGDQLFGGCSRVLMKHDSGLDKGRGHNAGEREWVREPVSEITPFLLLCTEGRREVWLPPFRLEPQQMRPL